MNNQAQPKLPSFFNKQISVRAGITVIMLAFSIYSGILIWQAQLLREKMKTLETVPEITIEPETTVKDETADLLPDEIL